MKHPSGPLTPIQQFIENSRNFMTKEPEYNLSQHDHPDPQSVLHTRTRQGYKLQFSDSTLYSFLYANLACLNLAYGKFVSFYILDHNA